MEREYKSRSIPCKIIFELLVKGKYLDPKFFGEKTNKNCPEPGNRRLSVREYRHRIVENLLLRGVGEKWPEDIRVPKKNIQV
ncbi:hypothetical protein DAPPUDRAFT_233360 [Daphnia pulex]|uniref:Uncharacterized protein n=1 Tax=Daphnia pulex TaxID=6669 RepID=E9FTW2_DAPPU|nr:hypothetical protein DAPPUDRAFT_233360 [Daphnia pulex]|eukprot:EFX89572.1 hypothetical protein DAPPUDRAFT_233360 [Daphnia pulex]